jgi:hypothetical protein
MIPSPCAETSTPVYMFPVTITPLQGTLPFSLPLANAPCPWSLLGDLFGAALRRARASAVV